MSQIPSAIWIALIAAGGSFITVALTKWLDYIIKIQEQKRLAAIPTKNSLDAAIDESGEVYPLLHELDQEYYSNCRISIIQFHNGGNWYSGGGIQRMTMTYELPRKRGDSIKADLQNVIVSGEQRLWLRVVIPTNGVYYPDTSLLPEGEIRDYYEFYNMSSVSVTLLNDDLGRLVGMLVISAHEKDFLGDSSRVGIKFRAQRLQRILTNS